MRTGHLRHASFDHPAGPPHSTALASTTRTLKSFRPYSQPPATAPAREAARYSAEDRSRRRAIFSFIATDYRRHTRIAMCGVVGGITVSIPLGVVIAMGLPESLIPWFAIPFVVCWLIVLGAMVSAPRLVCPGCCNEIEGSLGRYCPECGSQQLQPGGVFRPPRCTACGKSMRRGRGRHYKIHACTHCGLMLDDRGL